MSFIKGFEINFHSFADYLQTEDIIIIPKKVLNQSGFSGDLSISPLDGSLHVMWIHDSQIQYKIRSRDGIWNETEDVPNGDLFICFENADDPDVPDLYTICRLGGQWGDLEYLGIGDYPSLGRGYIFVAWNNSTGVAGPMKSELFCARTNEPGLSSWTPRFGRDDKSKPLYWENTGDPHCRVGVYSDGLPLFLNSRRMQCRYIIWNKLYWANAVEGPWLPGVSQVKSDGQTVWVISSSSALTDEEVSITGLRHPNAKPFVLDNNPPVITSSPDGGANTERNPSYTYTQAGIHTVLLTAENNDTSATEIKYNFITVNEGTSVKKISEIPETFHLCQNYPNPFNATTVIEFELPGDSEIHLTIYDTKGQMVKTLDSGVKHAGTYSVIWDDCSYHFNSFSNSRSFLSLSSTIASSFSWRLFRFSLSS